MQNITKWLHIICRILEVIVAAFVLIGIVLSIISLIKDDSHMFQELAHDTSAFHHYLEKVFTIVIGIEFLEMLCHTNSDSVIHILIFLVARHMIVGETTPFEDFVSVISIAVLFLLRKYMHRSEKDSGHGTLPSANTDGNV